MKRQERASVWSEIKSELSQSRKYIFIIIGIFFAFAIAGFVLAEHLSFLDALLRSILAQVKDLRGPDLFAFILLNNSRSALMSLFLGIGIGIVPVFNALFNGLVVGYVLNKVVVMEGISQTWRILPHGIFELPAIFIALGVGLRIGISILYPSGRKSIGHSLYRAVLIFIFIVLPLLIVAAFIESLLISLYK